MSAAGGLPLVVVRPEPGCASTLAAARAMGLRALACPLFTVGPVAWRAPDPADFDGLLIGSANVLRHGGEQLARLRGLPVHAVGETTGAAARAAAVGAGGLQPVLDALPPGTRVLRLAGAERIVLAPPAGVSMTECTVYAALPVPMPRELASLATSGAVVALHSAGAACQLSAELARLGLPRDRLALVAIGPRVAAAAGDGWATVSIADRADDSALLAKARDMCHTAEPDQ